MHYLLPAIRSSKIPSQSSSTKVRYAGLDAADANHIFFDPAPSYTLGSPVFATRTHSIGFDNADSIPDYH